MALTGFIRAHEHLPHWLAAAREASQNQKHDDGAAPQAAQAAQSSDAPDPASGKLGRGASISGMIDSEVYERLEHITQKVVREAKVSNVRIIPTLVVAERYCGRTAKQCNQVPA